MSAPSGYTKVGTVAYSDKGDYNNYDTYNRFNTVLYNGSTWVARHDGVTGVPPVEGNDWHCVARGFILVTDAVPIKNSTNPVQSGGVYDAVKNLNDSKQVKFRYVLEDQELEFEETPADSGIYIATLLNTDITSNTRAAVYFTDACIQAAQKAKMDIYTDTGRIIFRAKKEPTMTLVCDVVYQKEYVPEG